MDLSLDFQLLWLLVSSPLCLFPALIVFFSLFHAFWGFCCFTPCFFLFPSLFIPCSCRSRSTFFAFHLFLPLLLGSLVSLLFSCSFPLLFVSYFSSRFLFVSLGILMRVALLVHVHSSTLYLLNTFVVWLYRNQITIKVDVLVQPAPLMYKATRRYIKSETEESDEGKKSRRKLMKMIFPCCCWCFLQPHGPLIIVRVKKGKWAQNETFLRHIIILCDEKEVSINKRTAPVMV